MSFFEQNVNSGISQNGQILRCDLENQESQKSVSQIWIILNKSGFKSVLPTISCNFHAQICLTEKYIAKLKLKKRRPKQAYKGGIADFAKKHQR